MVAKGLRADERWRCLSLSTGSDAFLCGCSLVAHDTSRARGVLSREQAKITGSPMMHDTPGSKEFPFREQAEITGSLRMHGTSGAKECSFREQAENTSFPKELFEPRSLCPIRIGISELTFLPSATNVWGS